MNEGTPDTLNFLYYGLVAVFGILGAFIVSMWVRYRNLRRDEALLRELEDED